MNPTQDANALFNPAVNQIQAQIPAIQNLYATLLSGLQNQAALQGANIAQSAQQRGVGSPSLVAQLNTALGQEVGQGAALLNAQQAQGVAGLRGQIGQANVGRATAQQQFETANLKDSLEAQSNRYELGDLERQAALTQEQDRQDFEIRRTRFEKQEADRRAREAAAARAAADELDLASFVGNVGATLEASTGQDGKVSPNDFKEMARLWVSKGLPLQAFIGKYNKYVNSSHAQDYYNALGAGGNISDRFNKGTGQISNKVSF